MFTNQFKCIVQAPFGNNKKSNTKVLLNNCLLLVSYSNFA